MTVSNTIMSDSTLVVGSRERFMYDNTFSHSEIFLVHSLLSGLEFFYVNFCVPSFLVYYFSVYSYNNSGRFFSPNTNHHKILLN